MSSHMGLKDMQQVQQRQHENIHRTEFRRFERGARILEEGCGHTCDRIHAQNTYMKNH